MIHFFIGLVNMVLDFSEWHLDFLKMLPTQGFWLPKVVPFLGIFLPGHISDVYRV